MQQRTLLLSGSPADDTVRPVLSAELSSMWRYVWLLVPAVIDVKIGIVWGKCYVDLDNLNILTPVLLRLFLLSTRYTVLGIYEINTKSLTAFLVQVMTM